MAQTTPNLGLKVWNLASDTYQYDELANNFIAIDRHDHSPGNGAPIDGTSIKPGTIGPAQLGANSVNASNIVDGSVGNAEITPNSISGDKLSTLPGSRITSDNIESNTIAPNKLISGITPITSTTSSNIVSTLPTSGIYDGYIVDYRPTETEPASPFTTTGPPIWRLRYNSSNQRWYFIGGVKRYVYNTKTIISNGSPNDNTYYTGWGNFAGTGGAFCNVSVPLAGAYRIEYSANFGLNANVSGSYGTWGVGAYLGSVPTSTTIVTPSTPVQSSYFAGDLNATTGAYGVAEITVAANQPVNDRYFNLTAGFTNRNATTPGDTKVVRSQISIVPVYLFNWTV